MVAETSATIALRFLHGVRFHLGFEASELQIPVDGLTWFLLVLLDGHPGVELAVLVAPPTTCHLEVDSDPGSAL